MLVYSYNTVVAYPTPPPRYLRHNTTGDNKSSEPHLLLLIWWFILPFSLTRIIAKWSVPRCCWSGWCCLTEGSPVWIPARRNLVLNYTCQLCSSGLPWVIWRGGGTGRLAVGFAAGPRKALYNQMTMKHSLVILCYNKNRKNAKLEVLLLS